MSPSATTTTAATSSETAAAPAIHRSHWTLKEPLRPAYEPLSGTHTTDVLIVGGGITGLSTALELLERGLRVAICEAGVIGSGTTGGSTGHLDPTPEHGPQQVESVLGKDRARQYLAARLRAIDTIERRGGLASDFTSVPGYQYTEDRDRLEALRDEFENSRNLGLPVSWVDEVPFEKAVGGYRVEGCGRIDPLAYQRRLAALVDEAGGTIFERTVMESPSEADQTRLAAREDGDSLGRGHVEFRQLVLATHANFTPLLRLYVQTPAYQSYALAVRLDDDAALPDALFWDDSDPYYYVRQLDGPTMAVVGGCDHRTGIDGPDDRTEPEQLAELEDWARRRLPVREVLSSWSAELFEPADGLPLIGRVPGYDTTLTAIGLSGVGLTLGTLAGELLAAEIAESDDHAELREGLSPSRLSLSALGAVAKEQTKSTVGYVNHLLPHGEVDADSLRAGEGAVGSVDGQRVAVCRDSEGCLHKVSAICPHMKGELKWNAAEQTWDCPVHGGRFAADGTRLYGPPETDLEAK